MKQLLIISGKGGTGKTTIGSLLIKALDVQTFADCDVDAPNLHLVAHPHGNVSQETFYGLDQFKINTMKCISCGLCYSHCRFGAIKKEPYYQIDTLKCEGCGLCAEICPKGAITPIKNDTGITEVFSDENFLFSTAQLNIGKGNSGLLVSEVKKPLDDNKDQPGIAIIDGSPGIGCPVIASIRGVDYVLLVTEPTNSAFHDLKRILHTVQHFNIPATICINKYDLAIDITSKMETFALENHIPVIGKIPYDHRIGQYQYAKKDLTSLDGKIKEAFVTLVNQVKEWLYLE